MRLKAKGSWLLVPLVVAGGCAIDFHTAERVANLERATVQGPDRPELSYVHAGDRTEPRVIYVHGTPGDAGAFADFLNDPIPGLEAISVDRLGFGSSDPHAVVSFEEQAAAIEPLLVERDGRWPILVGHSLGGPIVARLAADEPGRVGGIVIVSGSLSPELEEPRWFNFAGAYTPANWFLSRSLKNSNAEIMAAKAQTELLSDVLPRIICPIVVVHGTEDSLVPFENVAYMRAVFAETDAEFVVLEGGDHFIPWTAPESIRAAVALLRDAPRRADPDDHGG